jgi:hypothetical protein
MDSPLLPSGHVPFWRRRRPLVLRFDHTPLPEVEAIRILHWLVPHEKCVCNLQNNNPTETRNQAKWPHGEHIVRPIRRVDDRVAWWS